MVLAHLGHEIPEISLRDLCRCDDDGTFQSDAVECAKHYGFVNSYWSFLQLDDLEAELRRGLFPIAYLELSFRYGLHRHAVVVTDMDSEMVEVLDPHTVFGGKRSIERKQFSQAWLAMNGLTILIQ